MKAYRGKRTVFAASALGVLGLIQTQNGFTAQPIPPDVFGWVIVVFAAVLLITRTFTTCPVTAVERRARPRVDSRGVFS